MAPRKTTTHEPWHEQVATVLALVVERHPPASAEQQGLARMLQASGGIRRALQASAGHCSVRLQPEDTEDECVAAFCAWLPAHAGLVKRLDISPVRGCCTCSNTWASVLAAAFQQCAPPPAPSGAAARPQGVVTRSRAAKVAAAAAKPPQLPLSLVELTASRALGPAATELAAALPGYTLTRLQLHARDADSHALLSRSIASLSRLRHLSLEGVAWPELARDIGRLRLTHLVLQGLRLSAVSALPASLHTLVLEVAAEQEGGGGGRVPAAAAATAAGAAAAAMPPARVSLGHLSQLRSLNLETLLPGPLNPHGSALVGLQLPAAAPLTKLALAGDSLALGAGLRALPVARRAALQHLDLQGAITLDSSLPELLRGMTGLQDVRLIGDAAWDDSVRVHAPQMAPLAAALGSLTQLTSLVLAYYDMSVGDEWQAGDDGIEWGERLKGLPSLRKLHLCFPLFSDDVDHLTHLEALSDLRLDDCSFGIDDEEFDIVCSSFPDLVSLEVSSGGLLCSSLFLVSVARLTGLTRLLLPGHIDAHLHVADLDGLTRLTRLEQLVLPHTCRNYMSPEHVQDLTDALPSLREVAFW